MRESTLGNPSLLVFLPISLFLSLFFSGTLILDAQPFYSYAFGYAELAGYLESKGANAEVRNEFGLTAREGLEANDAVLDLDGGVAGLDLDGGVAGHGGSSGMGLDTLKRQSSRSRSRGRRSHSGLQSRRDEVSFVVFGHAGLSLSPYQCCPVPPFPTLSPWNQTPKTARRTAGIDTGVDIPGPMESITDRHPSMQAVRDRCLDARHRSPD